MTFWEAPSSDSVRRDDGRPASGASQFLCRFRAKPQTPNPKLQRSSKSQTPNLKIRSRGIRRAGRFLSLELGASLGLEIGNWELFSGRSVPQKLRCPRRGV